MTASCPGLLVVEEEPAHPDQGIGPHRGRRTGLVGIVGGWPGAGRRPPWPRPRRPTTHRARSGRPASGTGAATARLRPAQPARLRSGLPRRHGPGRAGHREGHQVGHQLCLLLRQQPHRGVVEVGHDGLHLAPRQPPVGIGSRTHRQLPQPPPEHAQTPCRRSRHTSRSPQPGDHRRRAVDIPQLGLVEGSDRLRDAGVELVPQGQHPHQRRPVDRDIQPLDGCCQFLQHDPKRTYVRLSVSSQFTVFPAHRYNGRAAGSHSKNAAGSRSVPPRELKAPCIAAITTRVSGCSPLAAPPFRARRPGYPAHSTP